MVGMGWVLYGGADYKDNLAINAPGIYYPDVDIGPDGVFVDYECRSTDVF
jgi:hypothetical protein